MRWACAVISVATVLLSTHGAAASPPPGPPRSLVAAGGVEALALTGRSVAFAVGQTRASCPRVELWRPRIGARTRFRSTLPGCREAPSTGLGIESVALTLSRVLWISYTGGNIREWSLWTATPARKTPRRIRFAARDVDAPAPIVLGPGTNVGVPYAVDREITYLGDDGRALIRATVDSPVRLIAAGSGTPECGIVAAVASGAVLCVDGAGTVKQVGAYPPGSVRAVALGPAGAVFQVAREIVTSLPGTGEVGRMTLPAGATMVDIGQERVVWERRGDLGVTVFATRRSTLLADGSPARPVLGRLSGDGFAWARGRSVHWRPGRLP